MGAHNRERSLDFEQQALRCVEARFVNAVPGKLGHQRGLLLPALFGLAHVLIGIVEKRAIEPLRHNSFPRTAMVLSVRREWAGCSTQRTNQRPGSGVVERGRVDRATLLVRDKDDDGAPIATTWELITCNVGQQALSCFAHLSKTFELRPGIVLLHLLVDVEIEEVARHAAPRVKSAGARRSHRRWQPGSKPAMAYSRTEGSDLP